MGTGIGVTLANVKAVSGSTIILAVKPYDKFPRDLNYDVLFNLAGDNARRHYFDYFPFEGKPTYVREEGLYKGNFEGVIMVVDDSKTSLNRIVMSCLETAEKNRLYDVILPILRNESAFENSPSKDCIIRDLVLGVADFVGFQSPKFVNNIKILVEEIDDVTAVYDWINEALYMTSLCKANGL